MLLLTNLFTNLKEKSKGCKCILLRWRKCLLNCVEFRIFLHKVKL